MVYAASQKIQNAGQLDPFCRRGDAFSRIGRVDRRRQTGSLSAFMERVRRFLRADLSRNVRAADRGLAKVQRKYSRRVKNRRAVGLFDDVTVRRTLDRTDHTGRK